MNAFVLHCICAYISVCPREISSFFIERISKGVVQHPTFIDFIFVDNNSIRSLHNVYKLDYCN